MKKNLMLGAVMLITTVMFAQHRGHNPQERANKQSDKMKIALSLNDAQYATIKGINEKYATKRSELKNDSSSREAKHEVMKKLHDGRESEISAVLTPEQKTKWATYKAERVEKRKEHKLKHVEKHEARMKSGLSLSDEQAVKVQAAHKEFREKHTQLKKDSQSSKTEFKKLRADYEATIKSILTEEQFLKWTSMNDERRHKRKH